MSLPDPEQFSREWAQAWNSRDLEGVLRHFHDDAVFASPLAKQIVPGSEGVIRGKEPLRAYWTDALKRVPDLHFMIQGVYVGVRSLVIHYRNQKDVLVNEVLIFEGERVKEGYATYLSKAQNPAGLTAS